MPSNTTTVDLPSGGRVITKTTVDVIDGPGTPTSPTPDLPDPPTSGKKTDLGINVSHYRYTDHIVIDANSPTGYRVRPQGFKDLYGQFPCLRLMNHTAQRTAKKRNKVWGNRITENDAGNWDKTGLPIEALIETANACNADIWWPYPQQCDINFMVQAGKLFKTHLGGHLYLETPNEASWDQGYGWFYHGNSGGDWEKQAELFALDAKWKFKAFLQHFPADRTTRIIGGQLHNIGILKRNVIPRLDDSDWDMLTVSGYFGNRPDNWLHGSGGFVRTIEGLEQHAQLAADHGKRMGIYELNQSINVETSDFQLVDSVDVQQHILAVVDKCRSLGASPICVYSGAGRRYPNTPFPIYNTNYQPQGPTVATLGLPTL